MFDIGDEKKLYYDVLTGLPNFFKFIECDTDKVFGEYGIIIIIDMVNFENINTVNGYEQGDVCLKNVADIIQMHLNDFPNSSLYRTGGDEFTIILPHVRIFNGEGFTSSLNNSISTCMEKHFVINTKIRSLILNYDERIQSIEEFYHIVLLGTIDKSRKYYEGSDDRRWIDHIIFGFTRRIKDILLSYKNASRLALTDDVSGLYNHRAAKMYLGNLMDKISIKQAGQYWILFIDGDNLKRYNRVSYDTGNKMINELAKVIAGTIRKDDQIFRWLSGDEFLVILDGIEREDAINLAERIRVEVMEKTKDWIFPITISIGMSNYPNDGADIKEVVNNAEAANSWAKNLGKNRIVEWQDIVKQTG